MDMARYAAVMLAAGIGVPVLAALNAQLGLRIGSTFVASAVLFSVALAVALAAVAATGAAPAPPHLFLAGTLIAFYVLSVTWVAPRFGVGNAIFCVLAGQMLSAALIDHFALFGAGARPLTLARAAGIALMAGGGALVLKA